MVEITWQDCVKASNDIIETLMQKLNEEPEHGTYWQQQLAIAMLKRQEFIILAKKQEERQNMLRKNKEQNNEH